MGSLKRNPGSWTAVAAVLAVFGGGAQAADAPGGSVFPALEMAPRQEAVGARAPASLASPAIPEQYGPPAPASGSASNYEALVAERDALEARKRALIEEHGARAHDVTVQLDKLLPPTGECPAGTKNEVCRCMVMDGAPTLSYVPAAHPPEFCKEREFQEGMNSGRVTKKLQERQELAEAPYRQQRNDLEARLESLRHDYSHRENVVAQALEDVQNKLKSLFPQSTGR